MAEIRKRAEDHVNRNEGVHFLRGDGGGFRLEAGIWVARGREELFSFFSDAFNLEKITPPWFNFHVITPRPIRLSLCFSASLASCAFVGAARSPTIVWSRCVAKFGVAPGAMMWRV